MIPVRLPGGRAYPVVVGSGLDLSGITESVLGAPRVLLCHDARVVPPRLPGWTALKLPGGEAAKTFASWRRILDACVARDDGSPLALVAFGGGAVGDAVGFAAACYRRGIPFVQAPTTLLAMVDASVGGKTAINHPRAKNMVGAFHQPRAVVADLDRLATLPRRQLLSGMAEVVKHGVIGDSALLKRIEREPRSFTVHDGAGIGYAVERSVRLKASIVARDEKETRGVREALNLGHTLGHAIEAVHGYRGWLHGEAVAVGLVAAARISERILGFRDAQRVEAVTAAIGLPVRLRGESAARLLAATRLDKKRRTGRLRMTLMERVGSFRVIDGIDERLFVEIARCLGASR